MTWQNVVSTLLIMLIGYLIGSVSFSVIVSKIFKKEDIRSVGSGNDGATNTLRNYGVKFGLVVFLLDVLKSVIALLIAWILKNHTSGLMENNYLQFAGLAVMIGHSYPIYFNFKGGKGAATFVGFVTCINWVLFFVGIVVFMIIIIKTKKVSLVSTTAPIVIIAVLAAIDFTNSGSMIIEPLTYSYDHWVNITVISIGYLLILWKHRGNIKRLLKGTERNFK